MDKKFGEKKLADKVPDNTEMEQGDNGEVTEVFPKDSWELKEMLTTLPAARLLELKNNPAIVAKEALVTENNVVGLIHLAVADKLSLNSNMPVFDTLEYYVRMGGEEGEAARAAMKDKVPGMTDDMLLDYYRDYIILRKAEGDQYEPGIPVNFMNNLVLDELSTRGDDVVRQMGKIMGASGKSPKW
ncbi:MAG: hypothetical protein ACPGO5_04675 [Patescibacteria group bacterium]